MPAASRDRTPNTALRALLEETGWTQEAFAHHLARIGAEAGLRLRYDRTSVAHWLRGSRPRAAVQRLMAEALSRRLGRRVTIAELGMGGRGGPGPRRREPAAGPRTASARSAAGTAAGPRRVASPEGAPDAPGAREAPDAQEAPAVRRLPAAAVPAAGKPVDGVPALGVPAAGVPEGGLPPLDTLARLTTPAAGPALPVPYRLPPQQGAAAGTAVRAAARLPTPDGPGTPAHHHAGVSADVTSVREHLHFFAEQADRHGGGPVRAPLAAYVSGLTRRLRTDADGRRHRELLVGAARLSCLLARVYADEQRHGLAQRAFLTADGIAREADDPEGVALARRALSSQAHQLGHHRYSLELARAACAAAPAGAEPSARAFLYAGLAVAEAPVGGTAPALDALRRAEQELSRADALGGEPVGGYPDAALRYQAGQVRAQLGDRSGAITELRYSLRSRPVTERRARALSHAELAELLLAGGRLEEACAAWRTFLQDCSLVRSGRARSARARMTTLLRPYRREASVQALLVRSGAVPRSDGRR